jgi:hypothetical protein
MQPGQATALLAGQQKFLIHLCVKGMTGRDYSKVLTWYQNLKTLIPKFIELCQIEQSPASIQKALNVLKCGLFSHNLDVAVACATFFTSLWT